jgi:hypothetical protein
MAARCSAAAAAQRTPSVRNLDVPWYWSVLAYALWLDALGLRADAKAEARLVRPGTTSIG